MLRFRMKIIEGVLNSADSISVEKVIYDVIQEKIENGISTKKIIHTIPSLEFDLLFQIRLKRNQRELKNLIEALRIVKEGIQLN